MPFAAARRTDAASVECIGDLLRERGVEMEDEGSGAPDLEFGLASSSASHRNPARQELDCRFLPPEHLSQLVTVLISGDCQEAKQCQHSI
jgi:hypothetical protein